MKVRLDNESLPVHDYSNAIQGAVSWLGERHLLAIPVAAWPRRRHRPIFLLRSTPWLRTAKHRR